MTDAPTPIPSVEAVIYKLVFEILEFPTSHLISLVRYFGTKHTEVHAERFGATKATRGDQKVKDKSNVT